MKPRHVAAERFNARETLKACGIDVGSDYLTLKPAQVDQLIAAANRAKYQKPQTAKGSRARYFHDLLQRHAR